MAKKSRKNILKQKKFSRNQQKRKSRRLNRNGGGANSVSVLYVKGRENPEQYELIMVADNIQDLILQSKDVPENMVSPFKDRVLDQMYVQFLKLNEKQDTNNIRKLDPNSKVSGNQISSKDDSVLFYTYNPSGIVQGMYSTRKDLEHAFPGADIKSTKKNRFDWSSPLFQ